MTKSFIEFRQEIENPTGMEKKFIEAGEFIGEIGDAKVRIEDDTLELYYQNADIYLGFTFYRDPEMQESIYGYLAIGALEKEKPFNYEADLDQIKTLIPALQNRNTDVLIYNFSSQRKG